jgi:hypothetical protein
MRNRYKGTCYWCGNLVEPRQGHFERHKHQFLTIHAHCVFEQRKRKEDMNPENQCFWVQSDERLFNELKSYSNILYGNLAYIVQNDALISVREVNEWKDRARLNHQLPKILYEKVLDYLRLQYLIDHKSPRVIHQ